MRYICHSVLIAGLAAWLFAVPASAITVTSTTSAATLQASLLGGGPVGIDLGTVSLSVVSAHTSGGATSTGTYTNASNTYGIGDGIILSTGDVADYSDGPNNEPFNETNYGAAATDPDQEDLLDPITGGSFNHFDATQLDVSFDMLAGYDQVTFDVVFGSDEYPDFVLDDFLDGFGIYVNGTNVAILDGDPVRTNHPYMRAETGTELNGVLGSTALPTSSLVLTFTAAVNPTGNTVTFIIADTADATVDSTAYIAGLGGVAAATTVPEPLTMTASLLALGAVGLALVRRRA